MKKSLTKSSSCSQALRTGLLDTIPASSLDGLTAEDLRLLLNGTGEVNIHQLMEYTTFNDESGGMKF